MLDIKVKCFPASYGDSFLVNIKNEKESHNILIDLGFKETYNLYIRKELQKINCLDLIALTHIDDDHISGAIEFFKDNEILEKLSIKNIWFNDLYKIVDDKYGVDDFNFNINKEIEKRSCGIFDDEVSFSKANTLTELIYKTNNFGVWNKQETLIQCKEKSYKELYPINSEIKFVILSPNTIRIDELFSEWLKKIKIKKSDFKLKSTDLSKFYNMFKYHDKLASSFDNNCSNKIIDIEEMANKEFMKNSKANNSSIAFFIEIKDKKMLFLGDANAEDISSSLEQYKIDKKLEVLKFDLIKVSHHGSRNNINNKLFDIFYSDRYLISTNGNRHNHPDIECLSKIIVKQKQYKSLIFNYDRKLIVKKLNVEELKIKYNYDLDIPKKNGEVVNIDI
ncbi:MBL fold metallo-hydrolase [Clostridium perfringens]|nr:MBL fold metallo-hydrolase [Clostridium perfringens]